MESTRICEVARIMGMMTYDELTSLAQEIDNAMLSSGAKTFRFGRQSNAPKIANGLVEFYRKFQKGAPERDMAPLSGLSTKTAASDDGEVRLEEKAEAVSL